MSRRIPWAFVIVVLLFVSAVAVTVVEHVTDWRPRPTRVRAETFGCLFGTAPPAPAADGSLAPSTRQPGSDAWYRLDHLGAYGTVHNAERRPVRARIVAVANRSGGGTSVRREVANTVIVPAHTTQDWEISFPPRAGGADTLFAGLPEEYRCTAKVRSLSFVDQ